MTEKQLPVHSVADKLLAEIRQHRKVVLTAPTGSGKSTQVPRILFESGLIEGDIVVLQPRRLAARLLARRVAQEMNCPLGKLVGYQTRHASEVGPDTRIRFVTEGLFLRQLQSSPGVPRVGAVLLDEFHERHLPGDIILAILRDLQVASRPDLVFLVMSATLDSTKLAQKLSCPAIVTESRAHPVTIRYTATRKTEYPRPIWDLVARAVQRVLHREPVGDILVFMSGVFEINRAVSSCADILPENVLVVPLYGALSPADQDRAVTPGPMRKVIIATNVAETSLTIENVRHVVDSGLVRRQSYDSRRGLDVLTLGRVSAGSAEQRAGRAGRTAPGTCVRLWSEHEQRGLQAFEQPEILRLDLAGPLLVLATMGYQPDNMQWLTPPAAAALTRAGKLLLLLGATEEREGGRLTSIGRQMAILPMAPRLARMLVTTGPDNRFRMAVRAALLSEGDIFEKAGRKRFKDRVESDHEDDFAVAMEALETARNAGFDARSCSGLGIASHRARLVDQTARIYERALRRLPGAASPVTPRQALLQAWPDRVAARRSPESPVYDLPGGKSARLASDSTSNGNPLLVAADAIEITRSGKKETRLSMAVPISITDLLECFPDQTEDVVETKYDSGSQAVRSWRTTCYRDLVVERFEETVTDLAKASELLGRQILAKALKLRHWGPKEDLWIARTRCVAEWFPEKKLIRYDDDDLFMVFQELCDGETRFSAIRDRPPYDYLRNIQSWSDRKFIDKMAPERIQLPRGWRMKVSYSPGERPRGRAKIQGWYGLNGTPTVADGRQPLVLEILGPNFRPVQVTDDLSGFWTNHYPQLKKMLQRRYPKHEWR